MPRSGQEARGDTISWPPKLRCANLVSSRAGNVNNLGAAVQRELIGTVGAGTLEVSVRSDGDDGGSQFFSNS